LDGRGHACEPVGGRRILVDERVPAPNGNKLSARNTFIIDPMGKIASVFIKVNLSMHSEEVLNALAELRKHWPSRLRA
jgi:alkyl hydroperoxide reductase subunit AhpC